MGWYLSYFLFLLSEGQIRIGCEWVGHWSDGGRKSDVAACACALGHASSCDKGGCVGCMGDDVVGQCSGGVTILFPHHSILLFTHTCCLLTWRGRYHYTNTSYLFICTSSSFCFFDLSMDLANS